MDDTNSTGWGGRTAPRPLWAALALALAAAVQIALEASTVASLPGKGILRGRALPALLWVAAVPAVMWMGGRFPLRSGRRGRDVGVHVAAFGAWFVSTNLLLRLPDTVRVGWSWVARDTWAGMVRYAPTAVLLWAALAWLGRARRPAPTGAEGKEAAPPSGPLPVRAGPGAQGPSAPAALPLPGLNRIRLAPLARVRYLEADGDHVRVHTVEDVHRVRGRLSDFERRLAASGAFVRIHRSHLVNLEHLREVQPFQHGDYVAVMSDGAELRIPRTRRRALSRILGRDARA